jgi:GTPase SAR1 family protein
VKHHAPTVPLLLIGTKSDLRDEYHASNHTSDLSRPMTRAEGLQLAEDLGAYAYIECSSKRKESLKEILDKTVEAVARPSKKRRCRIDKCHLM